VFRSALGHKKSVTSRSTNDLDLMPVHRTRGDRPIAPKPRQHSGADGVRRARVGRSDDAQGDHDLDALPLPSSGRNRSISTP
jgi:hypothetical protein